MKDSKLKQKNNLARMTIVSKKWKAVPKLKNKRKPLQFPVHDNVD